MNAPRRLVVVSGTSGGLGSAIARELLEVGFNVDGVSRRRAEISSSRSDTNYEHVAWDLGDLGSLKALADEIRNRFGPVFGLVNNAAVGNDGLLPTLHNSAIEELIRVNLTSPIILTKYLIRPMIERRAGRVVNISSVVARTGYRGLAAYGATKAGLEGFTRSLARDVGSRGVTVNAVAPGFLETEMTSTLGGDNLARIADRAALKRVASTQEVAAAVAYLVSEDAAGVTGTVITVDAGATA